MYNNHLDIIYFSFLLWRRDTLTRIKRRSHVDVSYQIYIYISILHWLSKKIIISNFTSMAVCCFPLILVSSFVYIRIKWGETELSRRCMQYNGAILIPIQFFYFILFPASVFLMINPTRHCYYSTDIRPLPINESDQLPGGNFGWCRLLLLLPPTFYCVDLII